MLQDNARTHRGGSRRFGLMLALAALALPLAGGATAQGNYPNQPIHIVVPYPPGGLPDVVIRRIAVHLGERLRQPIVVENRPGAGGVAAAQALLSSPADGYNLIFSDAAMVTVSPLVLKNLPYDPKQDLAPVSYTARAPNFIAVNASVPVANWDDFVALAKKNPGKITCGSSGVGSVHHLTLELIKSSLDLDLVHVPFKGSGQSMPALLGGQIDCLLASLPPLAGAAAQGRVKILAVAGTDPVAVAPNIPPVGPALKGFNSAFILGILAKKGTPAEAMKRLSDEVSVILKMPDVVEALRKVGVEPVGGGPEAYRDALRKDADEMAAAMRIGKVKVE